MGGRGWRYYDKNFSYLMQEHHSTLAWDAAYWELWLHAQHSLINTCKSQIQGTLPSAVLNQTAAKSFPDRFCWRYHKGQFVAVVPLRMNDLSAEQNM